MSENVLVRAWKDEEGCLESPVGAIELTDTELETVDGMGGTRCSIFSVVIVACNIGSFACRITFVGANVRL